MYNTVNSPIPLYLGLHDAAARIGGERGQILFRNSWGGGSFGATLLYCGMTSVLPSHRPLGFYRRICIAPCCTDGFYKPHDTSARCVYFGVVVKVQEHQGVTRIIVEFVV